MKTDSPRPLLAALLTTGLVSTLSAQGVLVVDDDGGPGVDFVDLDAALVAAAPGDVVLVRTSSFAGSVTISKPLTLIADEGAVVEVQNLFIEHVPAGEIVVSGITVSPVFGFSAVLTDVGASVLFQDCALAGGMLQPGSGGGPGLSALDCTSITLAGCVVTGGTLDDGSPSTALYVASSTLVLFDTSVTASDGDPGRLFTPPEPGGDGLSAQASLVFAQGSTIRAGDGGDASSCAGAPGGAGVVLAGASELRLLDTLPEGGAGGAPAGGCAPGSPGDDVDSGDGTVVSHPGTSRTLTASPLVREQGTGGFQVTGQPGDMVVLGLDFDLSPATFLGSQPTPLLIGLPPPGLRLALGTIPASGTLTVGFTLGDLPPGQLAFAVQMQLAAFTGSGVSLGTPRRMVFLDASL